MNNSFTLHDIITGAVETSTTSIFPLEVSAGEKMNGSMPTFLYLAACAMVLRFMGKNKMDPELYNPTSNLFDKKTVADFQFLLKNRLSEYSIEAKSVLDENNVDKKGAFSKLTQARLLHWLLNSSRSFDAHEYIHREKETINAGNDIPMLTLPSPIMVPLTFIFGTDRNARIYAIQVAKGLYPEFSKKTTDKRIWSKTVHQKIIADLLDWHRTPEEILRKIPSLTNTPIPTSFLK